MSGVRMPERAGMDAEDDKMAYLCNFSHLCLLLSFIRAALFLLQQPENGTHLLNLEISGALWDIKDRFQIKASSVTGK